MRHALAHQRTRALLAAAGAALAAPLLLVGCGSDTTVNRTDPNAVRDLSGDWNATDSQTTAQAMISSITTGAWLKRFTDANHRPPVLKVGRIVNKSDEDISTRIFTDDIRNALINSGDVKVVASNDETENAREERRDQDVNASAETRRESFQETGCDMLLTGSIDVQHDYAGERKQKFYAVNLNLADVKSQELTWTGNKKIAKDVVQKGYN